MATRVSCVWVFFLFKYYIIFSILSWIGYIHGHESWIFSWSWGVVVSKYRLLRNLGNFTATLLDQCTFFLLLCVYYPDTAATACPAWAASAPTPTKVTDYKVGAGRKGGCSEYLYLLTDTPVCEIYLIERTMPGYYKTFRSYWWLIGKVALFPWSLFRGYPNSEPAKLSEGKKL